MKKVEIRKGIGAIHLQNFRLQYLMLWLRFGKELSLKLAMFDRDIYSYRRF